jgi:sugar lactone lactonase YvrE
VGVADPASGHSQALFSFSGRAGGLAVVDGATLVSDSASGTIWRVALAGTATPIVVTPARLKQNSEEGSTRLSTPAGLALSPDGSLFVADSTRHRVCAISPDGALRVVAGGANGYRDGSGTEAMFRFPNDVAVAADGTCYVADTGNDRIRVISPDGIVTTVAGSIYDYGDGRGPHTRFRRPAALDVDAEGTCWVADTGNNAIRRIAPDREVTTLAGEPAGGDTSGPGSGLRWPTGIAAATDGSLWVADHGNSAIRRIDRQGHITTHLRLSGRRWPTVVALGGDRAVLVAGAALEDVREPRAWVMIIGDER